MAPLLSHEAVFKEVNAVNSEFQNKQSIQSRASLYAMKSLVDKTHPFNKFPTGSIDTLQNRPIQDDINIIKELRAFYDKHYSANLMKLVIISSRDPNSFFPHVKHHFSRIPNKNVDTSTYYDKKSEIFRPKSYMVKYRAREVGLKILSIYWQLPYDKNSNGKQTMAYTAELFNNRGPQSLYRHLKDSLLVNSFRA